MPTPTSEKVPTTEPMPTSEPEPSPEPSTSPAPISVTTAPVNYCQVSDPSNYYLTISFVLCIDYKYLLSYERSNILSKVATFMNVPSNRITMYRLMVPDQQRVYDNIKGPPSFTCSNRAKLDHSLADQGGWRSVYNGYQTSVDVYFKCEHAQTVFDLVKKIKYKISLNKLHDHVGFHVIGWVLYRWYCLLSTTATSLP